MLSMAIHAAGGWSRTDDLLLAKRRSETVIHGATRHPPEPVCSDTVYIQTVLDCFSRHVWARLYTSKMPVTAVQILNNRVLPFFEEHGVMVETILSDNGREFRGREDQHPYELFLQLEEIEHRKTKVGRPQSNGFDRTLPPHAPGRADHLVRVGRGDAGRSGRLPRDLQPEPSAPRPRHGGADPVSGLQEGDPETQEPEEVSRKGGEDGSLQR